MLHKTFLGKAPLMSKTLSTLLTIFKVAKIVAKVIFILCIIGGAGCLLGLLTLPLAASFLSAEELVEEGLTLPSAYLGCVVGAISCAGEAVLAFFAERYFKHVLAAGTPFTFDGAKECFRFGITQLIVSVSISILAGIASFIFLLFSSPMISEPELSMSTSLSTGLFFLFISLIFKHGAEIHQAAAEAAAKEEPSETEAE